jgi:hypothetical protein
VVEKTTKTMTAAENSENTKLFCFINPILIWQEELNQRSNLGLVSKKLEKYLIA